MQIRHRQDICAWRYKNDIQAGGLISRDDGFPKRTVVIESPSFVSAIAVMLKAAACSPNNANMYEKSSAVHTWCRVLGIAGLLQHDLFGGDDGERFCENQSRLRDVPPYGEGLHAGEELRPRKKGSAAGRVKNPEIKRGQEHPR